VVETLICPLSEKGQIIDRCLAIEDYEPMSLVEVEALPPVGQWPSEACQKASE
jgi:hypothetical protein